MKIMVVDDEEDVQLLFRQKFRKEIKKGQIEFQFAFSAQEALEYLNGQPEHSVVLILSDINMPGMNGLELLKIIKEKFPHLKVFMITAYGDEENYKVAMEYGADDYLHKPVEFDTLKDKILNY
ncbi:response regulator [Allocoleopsis franciscana]|uniref:Response regulator with CheY-like receiver, AAA-type ATPase, and DNA-binding domains n=1 Tax=Allocoleopsis franciscana PCC 7113 TaxID=1173027 RepID=K9W955_9CYAN|nr:response regulator [Allocoleopsis franciscana]AFZ16925.1 response regulator with CheY-like receiver, AAA-type ATPase, and DNA-binding domains [Allocoleopsis franciscana PCC 7113]